MRDEGKRGDDLQLTERAGGRMGWRREDCAGMSVHVISEVPSPP